MDFAIGKGQSLFPAWMRVNVEVRLLLASDDGRKAFGCSADWPSFGWLDKRPEVEPKQKLRELLELVMAARTAYLSNANFETAFGCWWKTQAEFLQQENVKTAVPLCSSFALALFERAVIDAVCRIEGLSFYGSLRQDRLGFRAELIHDELQGFSFVDCLPEKPLDRIKIRHTIGSNDPLTADDVDEVDELNDGEPFTLEEYLAQDGITCLKIKICGDRKRDLKRLDRIWSVVSHSKPTITLDGNEAYDDVTEFGELVEKLSRRSPKMFEQILFIEQPMSRAKTLDSILKPVVETIESLKPLIIDEADGYLHAFADAVKVGYHGVSHKNCKGIFKSLANYALCKFRSGDDGTLFLSAEDLTNMPIVALHQDFAVISALGLPHAERNGHHFFFGLAHLTDQEQRAATTHYPGLYKQRDGELFLKIENGQVDISSLQKTTGLGVASEPNWASMTKLEDWIAEFKQ